MNQETRTQLLHRLKSFGWRLGAVVLVAVLNFTVENLTELGFSGNQLVVAGLILGEVTKYFNRK